MSDDAKHELLNSLTRHMDEALLRICAKLATKAYETKLIRKDYVAQIAVLEFVNVQVTPAECDAVGVELRAEWPEMPDLIATLFKLSDKNSKLILDFNSPHGIEELAQSGDISELIVQAQKSTADKVSVPVMSYDLTQKPIKRVDKTLTITRNAF